MRLQARRYKQHWWSTADPGHKTCNNCKSALTRPDPYAGIPLFKCQDCPKILALCCLLPRRRYHAKPAYAHYTPLQVAQLLVDGNTLRPNCAVLDALDKDNRPTHCETCPAGWTFFGMTSAKDIPNWANMAEVVEAVVKADHLLPAVSQ